MPRWFPNMLRSPVNNTLKCVGQSDMLDMKTTVLFILNCYFYVICIPVHYMHSYCPNQVENVQYIYSHVGFISPDLSPA